MKPRAALLIAGVFAVVAAWILTPIGSPDLPIWQRYTPLAFTINLAATYAVLGLALVLTAAPGRALHRVRKLGILTASAVVSLVLIESPAVVLGHDYQTSLGTLGPEAALGVPFRANRLDPELIHVHHPNSGFSGRVRGNLTPMGIPGDPYEVEVAYDSRGFRNERELDLAEIVVIGDSFVEAALLPVEETLPVRIEKATGLVTVNFGQAAYGVQQELVVLRRYALSMSPRLVVWCFFGGNDLRDAGNYEELREAYDELGGLMTARLTDRLFTTNAVRKLKRLLEEGRLSTLARRHSGIFEGPDGGAERIYFRRSEGPWGERLFELATSSLLEASELCNEAGAAMLVLYIPRKFRVYEDFVRFEPDAVCLRWSSNDLPNVLGTWCAENGIAFADTTPALRERVARGEHVYLADDVHWNGRGHEVAAELVMSIALREGWIDGEASR